MAITNDFFTALNDPKAATWAAGVAFNRSNPLPLDKWSVFQTKSEAETYASGNAVAYPGQIIAVHNAESAEMEVYVLAEQNGTLGLQEMGGKIDMDGKSLSFTEDGLLQIAGFAGAASATLPQKKVAEDGTVTLEWVTVDAIVEGDGNTTYTIALAESTEENPVVGIVLTPYDGGVAGQATSLTLDAYTKGQTDAKIAAAVEAEAARAGGAEKTLQDNIDTLAGTVEANKKAADDALALKADITYVDGQIDALEEAIGNLNHFTTEIVESIEEVVAPGILYLIKDADAVGDDKYKEYLFVGEAAICIGDTSTDLNGYYNKDSADAKFATIAALEAEAAAARAAEEANAGEIETLKGKVEALEGVDNATQEELDAYKQEMTTALDGKADKATTLAGYGITDAYTKEETLDKIEEKITEINGGESAGEVLSQLNSYKEINDAAVDALEEKMATIAEGAQVNKLESISIGGVAVAIDEAKNADLDVYKKGEVDSKVSEVSSVASAAHTQALSNAGAISTLQATVSGENGHASRIAAIETTVQNYATVESNASTALTKANENAALLSALQGTVDGHTTTINDHGARIAAMETTVAEQAATILAHADSISKKADKTALDELAETVAGLKNYDDAELRNLIAANASAAETNAGNITAVAGKVDKLIGADSDKSVRTIAAEAINALIGGVSDADTIEGITSLIEYVNLNGATTVALQKDVADNKSAISILNGDANTAGSVLAIVNTEIAKLVIPEADGTTIVNENGVFSVGEISTDQLVQGLRELVLVGGTASN